MWQTLGHSVQSKSPCFLPVMVTLVLHGISGLVAMREGGEGKIPTLEVSYGEACSTRCGH